MLKIAVVEDEKEARDNLLRCINKYEEDKGIKFEIKEFRDGSQFLDEYASDFDMIFLDIQMPNLDGMETAKKIRETDPDVCLIFVTSMAQYAIKGYEYHAFDFLLKPVEYDFFRLKMEKAVNHVKKKADAYVILPDVDGQERVRLSDIMFIESDKHYIYYHSKDKTYKVRESLRSVENKYTHSSFALASNTCLVNLSYVEKFTGDGVYVKGQYIPVSRSRKKDFLAMLAVCLGAGL